MNTIFLATHKGSFIRFPETDRALFGGNKSSGVRVMGRATKGPKGIDLREGDKVVSMELLTDDLGDLVTVTASGIGRRTPVSEFKIQSRGGKGITNLRVDGNTGPVVGVCLVRDIDSIILITKGGKLIRLSVYGMRRMSKGAKGVRLFDVQEGDTVASVVSPPNNNGQDIPICPSCFERARPAVLNSPRAVFWKCRCGFLDVDGQEFPEVPSSWPDSLHQLDGWVVVDV